MNIRTLCLGILYLKEATGYEINKLVSEGEFSHFIEASYGSIYPALNKLTDEGLLTWHEEAHPGKPARKVYAITDEGRAAFAEFIQETPKADLFKSEFLFTCLYADLLPPDHLRLIIEGQMEHLQAGLDHLTQAKGLCDRRGTQFAIGYGIAMKEAALKYLQENYDQAVRTELRGGENYDEDCSPSNSADASTVITAS